MDSSSSTDILFLDALKKMEKLEKNLKNVNSSLMGFASSAIYPVEAITLLVYLGERWKALIINITFIVVDVPASYNAILGCSTLKSHRIVHSPTTR